MNEMKSCNDKLFKEVIYLRKRVQELEQASLIQSENEKKLLLLMDSVHQAYWETDSSGVYLSDMPSWRDYTGQAPEELLGYGWINAVHPDDRENALNEWRKDVAEKKNHNIEYRLRSPNGEWKWSNVIAKPVFDDDGNVLKWVGINIDINKRKEAELKMAASEEKYRYLFNYMDEGVCIIEPLYGEDNKPCDVRYLEVNPAFEKQSGIKSNNIKGRTAKELNIDFEEVWYDVLDKVLTTGEPIRDVSKVKSLNCYLDFYAFKVNTDGLDGVAYIFKNITDQVIHKQKIEELLRTQDEIYANISHELKTPLNVIFSANQLTEHYLNELNSDDLCTRLIKYNKSIKQNCFRLLRLINNIVDLSKSNSGFLKLKLSRANIVEVIENIVQSVSVYASLKQLKIIFDTDVEEKIIDFDPDMIERVMLNLISNAIKFSNPNGEIYVNVHDLGDRAEVIVKDNGIGIEKENLDKLFDRYYQAEKTMSRNAEGSGIGLSLIKSIIEKHGGKIGVESEPNKGSTFKFELPATAIGEVCRETKHYISDDDKKIQMLKIEFSDIYYEYSEND